MYPPTTITHIPSNSRINQTDAGLSTKYSTAVFTIRVISDYYIYQIQARVFAINTPTIRTWWIVSNFNIF